jgi:hypothetical protein
MVQIGNYNYSDYYSTGAYAPREGTLSYEEFNPEAYLQLRPDVARDRGFTGQWSKDEFQPNDLFLRQYDRAPTRDESLYAHYQGVWPGDPVTQRPDQYQQQGSDPFRRSAEEVQQIRNYQTAQSSVNQYSANLSNFIDSNTNQIRQDLLGGDILPEGFDLQAAINAAKGATDPNDPSVQNLKTVLDELNQRKTARDTGYLGVFEGDGYEKFKQAVGSKQSYADPYGKTTALGEMAELAESPELPPGTELSLERYQAQPDEFLDADKYKGTPTQYNVQAAQAQVSDAQAAQAQVSDVQAAQAQVSEAVSPTKIGSTSYEATQVADQIAKTQIQAAKQQGLTDYVEPAKGEVDVKSTVQGQLAQLMQQFEGGRIPAFAAGAIRTAEQRLAARGMGASSMAGAAIVQAAMEASTPIAAADAETYRRMQELNLNNRQQAEVLNAQMTLQMDLQNLSNEQQARVTNTQNLIQGLFNDQAAVNSAKQFNATSEQQNDQFFASLFNQTAQFNAAQKNAISQFNSGQTNAVAQFNAAEKNAISQFNAGQTNVLAQFSAAQKNAISQFNAAQTNAVSQFNSELANQRDQFNLKNSIVIDQANAVYRRQINTANTAIANAENEFNVRNLFNISQNAQAQILQQQRDEINFARVSALNDQEYRNNLALASFAYDRDLDLASDVAVGGLFGSIAGGIVGAVFSKTAKKTP